MAFDKDNEIKNDLVHGIKMNEFNATNHYVDNPEKIILTICELSIMKNNGWVSRDEIQFSLEQELREQIIEYRKYKNKWNPVDWFSKHYTDITDNKLNLKKGVIPRWVSVLDRTKSNKKWAYRIKPEYYREIKMWVDDIKKNTVLKEKIEAQPMQTEKDTTQKKHIYKDISFGDKALQVNNGLVKNFEQTPKPLYNYFEKDVEEKLFDELHKLGLKIYEDSKGRSGRQFDTFEVGRIDLLCTDSEGNFIVLDLKKGNANQDVISQI